MKKINPNYIIVALLMMGISTKAQFQEKIYMPSIHTVKLFQEGNQESIPALSLASSEKLELHFDDFDGDIKNFFYTYQLCNADWQPAMLGTFDYLSGFQQQRIRQYRQSSITLFKYIHYSALLPENNCIPTKSGNYILKVFLNSDTSQLVFTKKFFVVDNKAGIKAYIMQPFDNSTTKTHQKVQCTVDLNGLTVPNPLQQIKVALFQNYDWDKGGRTITPTFIRSNLLEFNPENDCIFESGREFRWLDLRNLRYLSDKMAEIRKDTIPNCVLMKPEGSRRMDRYLSYYDRNGISVIGSTDVVNTWWQTSYALVKFIYIPENKVPYKGYDLLLSGEMAKMLPQGERTMTYNAIKGFYEIELLLKEGYYSYRYVLKKQDSADEKESFATTEGNYWETENNYTIMVYYRAYSGRHDELVGFRTINSRLERGF